MAWYERFLPKKSEHAAPRYSEAVASIARIDQYLGGLENPHSLFRFKTLSIVDVMMQNDVVGTLIDMKKAGVLSSGWEVEPAMADDPTAQEVADETAAALENVKGTFSKALRGTLSAYEYGFSVSNPVHAVMETGDHMGKVGLSMLKTKPPHCIKFKCDEFANIVQVLFEIDVGRPESYDPEEFVIYTYNPQFDNPYGYSDCIRAYDRWNSLRHVDKFSDIHLERYGGGSIVAQHDGNANADEHQVVNNFIQNKSILSSVKLSDHWEINRHEADGRGTEAFDLAINSRVKRIARAVFWPDQMGFSSDDQAGSFARSKTILSVLLWTLDGLRNEIEETIVTEQIIPDIVYANRGEGTPLPRFRFKPLTDEQKINRLTNIVTAIEKGALTPDLEIENTIRRDLELAEKEEEEEERAGGSPPGEEPEPEMDDLPFASSFQMAQLQRKPNQYEAKVDFPEIVEFINETEQQFKELWTGFLFDARKQIINAVTRKKIIETGDISAVDGLKFPKRMEMRKALQRFMLSALYFGALQSQKEVRQVSENIRWGTSLFQIDLADLPLDQVAKIFIDRGLEVTKGLRTAAAIMAGAKGKAFTITNVTTERILSQARFIIFNGIDRADPNWTQGELRRLFQDYLETGELKDGALSTAHRIETIQRNTFTDSFNQGRRAYLEDPDVSDFVEAYMWSAIIDDGTTDYCRSMDQRILRKEDLNAQGWPGAHHNCRSFVVPVVRGERFEFSDVPAGVSRGAGFQMMEVCC